MSLPPSHYAPLAVADMVGSTAAKARYASHYISESQFGNVEEIAGRIRDSVADAQNWRENLAVDPNLVAFMRELVDLQRCALRPIFGLPLVHHDPEDRKLLQSLDEAAAHLAEILPSEKLPRSQDLPAEYRKILDMVKKDTGQVPFRPVARSAKAVLGFFKYLGQELYEHKKVAIPGFAAAACCTWLLNAELGMTRRGAFSAEDTGVVNYSFDNIFDEAPPAVNPAYINLNFQGGCDNHFQRIEAKHPKIGAALKTVKADALIGMHCMNFNTQAYRAQQWLGNVRDGYNLRLDYAIKNPVLDLGNRLLSDPRAQQAYLESVETHDRYMKAANNIENVTLHFAIPFIGLLKGFNALSSRGSGGNQKQKNSVKISGTSRRWYEREEPDKKLLHTALDFGNRTIRNNILAYTGLVAAVTHVVSNEYFWSATRGLNPEVVWMGLAGVIAGNAAHKLINTFNRRSYARNLLREAKNDLANLPSSGIAPPPLRHRQSLLRHFGSAAAGTAAIASLVELDIRMTGGQVTARVLGAGAIWGSWLGVNPVEDMSTHGGLGIIGYGTGAALGVGYLGLRYGILAAISGLAIARPYTKKMKNVFTTAAALSLTLAPMPAGRLETVPPPAAISAHPAEVQEKGLVPDPQI